MSRGLFSEYEVMLPAQPIIHRDFGWLTEGCQFLHNGVEQVGMSETIADHEPVQVDQPIFCRGPDRVRLPRDLSNQSIDVGQVPRSL